MDKTGAIFMSISFHSRITRKNQSNNERATLNGLKIILLGLDAKKTKRNKSETNNLRFLDIFFKEKIGPPQVYNIL